MTTTPAPPPPHEPPPLPLEQVAAARTLFWHNVMREMLTSLSVACLSRLSRAPQLPAAPGEGPVSSDDLFDGRLAILTHAGERIPIADVFPLFACGLNTDDRQRAISVAVECTVFQIRTPDGQVFTLPLSEMRAFHALTPELMRRLEELARTDETQDDTDRIKRPFGFAAYTTSARPPDPYYPVPPAAG